MYYLGRRKIGEVYSYCYSELLLFIIFLIFWLFFLILSSYTKKPINQSNCTIGILGGIWHDNP